jgi:predicted secreted protein
MTLAAAAVGSEFQLGDTASPTVYTKVAEVLSISGPEVTAEEIDVTSLDSANGYKEYITGLKDGGSVSLEANWIKSNTQQTSLRDLVDSGTTRWFRIVFADSPNTVAVFQGVVTTYSMAAEPTAQLKANFSVRISGQITWS